MGGSFGENKTIVLQSRVQYDSSVATPTKVTELNQFGTGSSGKLHRSFRIFIDLLNQYQLHNKESVPGISLVALISK